MTKLSARRRRRLPKSKFASPKGSAPNRKKNQYPIDTKNRAANAKARAKQQLKRNRLSRATYRRIVSKANRKLRSNR